MSINIQQDPLALALDSLLGEATNFMRQHQNNQHQLNVIQKQMAHAQKLADDAHQNRLAEIEEMDIRERQRFEEQEIRSVAREDRQFQRQVDIATLGQVQLRNYVYDEKGQVDVSGSIGAQQLENNWYERGRTASLGVTSPHLEDWDTSALTFSSNDLDATDQALQKAFAQDYIERRDAESMLKLGLVLPDDVSASDREEMLDEMTGSDFWTTNKNLIANRYTAFERGILDNPGYSEDPAEIEGRRIGLLSADVEIISSSPVFEKLKEQDATVRGRIQELSYLGGRVVKDEQGNITHYIQSDGKKVSVEKLARQGKESPYKYSQYLATASDPLLEYYNDPQIREGIKKESPEMAQALDRHKEYWTRLQKTMRELEVINKVIRSASTGKDLSTQDLEIEPANQAESHNPDILENELAKTVTSRKQPNPYLQLDTDIVRSALESITTSNLNLSDLISPEAKKTLGTTASLYEQIGFDLMELDGGEKSFAFQNLDSVEHVLGNIQTAAQVNALAELTQILQNQQYESLRKNKRIWDKLDKLPDRDKTLVAPGQIGPNPMDFSLFKSTFE